MRYSLAIPPTLRHLRYASFWIHQQELTRMHPVARNLGGKPPKRCRSGAGAWQPVFHLLCWTVDSMP